jgi:UDP-glucose 4-epimerase
MAILVTGGLGFIGSHTCVSLLASGHEVVVLDDLSNSSIDVLDRIETIAGRRPSFVHASVNDTKRLPEVFLNFDVSAVIHFAALKAVADSMKQPLAYYAANVTGTVALLNCMQTANVRTFVFSSSATVYGLPPSLPIREDFPRSTTNPYGRSKLIVEDVLTDLSAADSSWRIANLRYFNPIGAHESGMLGERPQKTPNNLMPFLLQVAAGERERLDIFGGDYPTRDGSCIRDFIHVVDLAEGHVAALRYLGENSGNISINLGAGRGVSVFEICDAFERSTGCHVPRRVVDRRPGDVPESWADVTKARRELGWFAHRDIDAMCRDAWRWQSSRAVQY